MAKVAAVLAQTAMMMTTMTPGTTMMYAGYAVLGRKSSNWVRAGRKKEK